MNEHRRNAVLVLGATALASAGAYAWTPRRKVADSKGSLDLEKMVPVKFGDWRVDDSMPVILPPPDLQASLDRTYNQVLSRTYINRDGERVMLSVAYGGDQSDGTRAHRPESCYPAQGFAIISNRTGKLNVASDASPMPVRRLVARAGGRWEPITYWIVVGEQIALSGTEQKIAQLAYGVRGLIPDGLLFRVSNISRDSEASFRLHELFVQQAAAPMSMQDRERLFGDRRLA
jgi:EpsI family protein